MVVYRERPYPKKVLGLDDSRCPGLYKLAYKVHKLASGCELETQHDNRPGNQGIKSFLFAPEVRASGDWSAVRWRFY